jgi:branched-chain amino acid transport system permease protein
MILTPIFISNKYYINVLVLAMITCIATLGFRLIQLTGHLSLAQGVFIGIGAYTSVTLVGIFGISFWAAMPLAGVVAAIIGLIIAWPALRLKGAYFAILTLGLSEVFRVILLNFWSFSGGPSGIPGGETTIESIPRPENILFINFSSRIAYFYLVLIVLIIVVLIFNKMDKSTTGKTIDAIRQSDDLALSIGINVIGYKMNAFIIACFFTGISGALLAHYLNSITPGDFNFWKSSDIVLFSLIGGLGNILGPIVGVIGMTILSNSVASFAQYQSIIYGVVAIIFIMLLPDGLVGIPKLIKSILIKIIKNKKNNLNRGD